MDSLTRNLARQLAKAFEAAYPESVMAAPPPQPQAPPVAKAPESPSCDHQISARITPQNSRLCPSCQIARHVQAIKDVQRDLAGRGGVFTSKDMSNGHKPVRQRWRVEKLRAINTLDRFQLLLRDAQLSEKDKSDLAKAFKLWEDEAPHLERIPGVVYQDDAVQAEPSEEEHEVARLMIELLKLVLQGEMAEEDKEATSLPIRPRETAPDDQAFQDPSEARTSQPATPKARKETATQAMATLMSPRSILKRQASPGSPKSPQRKRLRFNRMATVSPAHLNFSNATSLESSPLTSSPIKGSRKPAATLTTQPHRKSTSVDFKRHSGEFKRTRPEYTPGTWASGAFEEKANTSWCTVYWESAERQMKQEEKEAQEEAEVLLALKVIVSVWTSLWWVRKVTRHIDLKELESKMGKD
jgi:hypothetical protein